MLLARHIHFSEIDSTNSWALRALEQGSFGQERVDLPILITAERQTAGRGQKTRTWYSPPGCLTFSLVFRPSAWGITLTHTPLLGFACANAILATLETVLSPKTSSRFAIHWPNDVYYAPENQERTPDLPKWRKFSGILLEGHASGFMTAGIGLNLLNRTAEAPKEIRNRMISLREIEPNWIHSPLLQEKELKLLQKKQKLDEHFTQMEPFLATLLNALKVKFKKLAQNPTDIIAETDFHCVQKGEYLTIQTPHGLASGYCAGLSSDGSLLLDGIPHRTGIVHFND